MLTLDKVKMTVIQTAENGVVNKDTFFILHKRGMLYKRNMPAERSKKGFLSGRLLPMFLSSAIASFKRMVFWTTASHLVNYQWVIQERSGWSSISNGSQGPGKRVLMFSRRYRPV